MILDTGPPEKVAALILGSTYSDGVDCGTLRRIYYSVDIYIFNFRNLVVILGLVIRKSPKVDQLFGYLYLYL